MDTLLYPQLQLEQPQQQLPVVYGTIRISKQAPSHGGFNFVHEPVYHPSKWERKYLQEAGITASIYDPCIPVEITFAIDADHKFSKIRSTQSGLFLIRPIIPVKYLINFSTKSIITLNLYGHSVKFVCEKNPLINNKGFHQQFEKRMKKYYKNPKSWADIGRPAEEELIPAGIVIELKHTPNVVINHIDGSIMTTNYCTTYTHGPNGYPNELALAKLAAGKEKLLPYNNSMYRFIMNRETGQIRHFSHKTCDNINAHTNPDHHSTECTML